MSDVYQERYIAHQKRKKESLISSFGTTKFKTYNSKVFDTVLEVFKNRRSQRFYSGEVSSQELEKLMSIIRTMPSSCDRKPIFISCIESRDSKALLGGLLVGGVGWVHRSDKIILLFADMTAYKNPAERDNMPYLDAGVCIQSLYIGAEALNIGGCYVNPNIREENKDIFNKRFNPKGDLFCGAFAIGKYNKKAIK